jgi:Major Facilitator Superfamily.
MEKLVKLVTGLMMLNIVYSLYYTISRPLFGVDLYGSWIILYITGAEYAPSLLSFIIGVLGDVYGRKKILALGLLGFTPLLLIFTVLDWKLVTVSIGFYSLFYSIVSIIALSSLIEDRARVGTRYSYAGLAMGVGWGIGSAIAWPMYISLGQVFFALITASLYVFAVFTITIGYSGKDRELSTDLSKAIQHVFVNLAKLAPIILLSYIGISIGSNINALIMDSKLREVINISNSSINSRFFYGLFYGTLPVLLGTPLRFLIGKFIDKGYEEVAFIGAVFTYLILFLVLPYTPPLLFIILWALPVYPFYDTSIYAIISKSTSSFEASVTGFLSSIYSLAGLVIILLNTVLPIDDPITYITLITISLTTPLILFNLLRSKTGIS